MKASVMHTYGGPEVMQYQDFADPFPAVGEVLVRVAAASINPVDLMQRAGDTKASMPVDFPGVIGWDVAGTIEALGPGVTRFQVGDRVMAWAFHTFAELCVIKAELLAIVPPELDLVEAAALPLVGTTGSQLISMASELKAGQTVLVSGANGGVGRSAVYTAKDLGAYVIAGVTSGQLDEAGKLGADLVIALDIVESFNSMPSVDVVANCLRGAMAAKLIAKVKRGGIFASVTGAPTNALEYPKVRVVEFVSKQSPVVMSYIAAAVRDGKLSIKIGRKIPLREAAAGMAAVAGGGIGKVLLLP
ncbi:MAG: NADP-dependent oxidoreductase [Janthinobacterium lividum]